MASHLGSYSHATSGWNIVKCTADIWDSQIPYWIAWTAIFQLLVGWSTLTARTFKYCICTQVSCFVYRLIWWFEDRLSVAIVAEATMMKKWHANFCCFAFDQPAGTFFQWELRNISGAQISLTIIFNPKYCGLHGFSPNFPSNSGFMNVLLRSTCFQQLVYTALYPASCRAGHGCSPGMQRCRSQWGDMDAWCRNLLGFTTENLELQKLAFKPFNQEHVDLTQTIGLKQEDWFVTSNWKAVFCAHDVAVRNRVHRYQNVGG